MQMLRFRTCTTWTRIFQNRILDQVRSSKVVILVIGKVFDLRAGELNNQNDYVGQEIRAANEARVPILPILVDKDIDEIKIPGELSNILGIQNRLFLKADSIQQLKRQLPRILPQVVPHLPGYWKRRADYWWTWAATMAAIAPALLLLWIVEICTEVVGTSVERFRTRSAITNLLQDGRLLLTSLDYGTAFVQNLPPNVDKSPRVNRFRSFCGKTSKSV